MAGGDHFRRRYLLELLIEAQGGEGGGFSTRKRISSRGSEYSPSKRTLRPITREDGSDEPL